MNDKFLADTSEHTTQNFKDRIEIINMMTEPIKIR